MDATNALLPELATYELDFGMNWGNEEIDIDQSHVNELNLLPTSYRFVLRFRFETRNLKPISESIQVKMGTETEIYATFVMTVVAEEDTSRSIWPSCPAFGWSTGVGLGYQKFVDSRSYPTCNVDSDSQCVFAVRLCVDSWNVYFNELQTWWLFGYILPISWVVMGSCCQLLQTLAGSVEFLLS